MGSLSPVHWFLVALVVLLLFGPARLAAMGRDVGQGIRSFKKGVNEDPPLAEGERDRAASAPAPLVQTESTPRKPSSELRPN